MCQITIDKIFYGLQIAFSENIPYIINSGVFIHYAIVLNKINKRFEGINLIFSKLDITKINSTQISTITQIVPLRVSVLKDIINIKYAYRKLIEACEDISNFYGAPVLITFISLVGKGLTSTYLGVLLFMNIELTPVPWYQTGIRLSWIMLLFIILTSKIATIAEQVLLLTHSLIIIFLILEKLMQEQSLVTLTPRCKW
ncbi:GSCOCG00012464001-RA-CDS, partial [Cotesia congregata]